jgi:hypothetical protein
MIQAAQKCAAVIREVQTLTANAKLNGQLYIRKAPTIPRNPESEPRGNQKRDERNDTLLHAIQAATRGCAFLHFDSASHISACTITDALACATLHHFLPDSAIW